MATYTQIPYMPEGVLDPAAGINEALRVIRAVTRPLVVDIGATSPPALSGGGDKYIVGPGATGAWAGMENYMAEDMGDHWDFFQPGTVVQFVVNLDDGQGYYYDPNTSGWAPLVVAS